MIDITATIQEYNEDGVEYILKEYNIISNHPHSVARVLLDNLVNQTFTNEEGVATISTANTAEHEVKVTINNETTTAKL